MVDLWIFDTMGVYVYIYKNTYICDTKIHTRVALKIPIFA